MKSQKKLQLKKETVEALNPILARYVQGGCSKGDITVISKDCGNPTTECTNMGCQSERVTICTCNPQTNNNCPSIYTCADICGGSVVRCIGDL